MKKRSQSDGAYALEGLEPRLLLSADPIGGFMSPLDAGQDDPMDAIVVPASEDVAIAEQENDDGIDLFNGIEDEPLPVAAKTDSGSPEMEDPPTTESTLSATFTDTDTNKNFDSQIAPAEVDLSSIMTEQMVTTLHAGNSPPDHGPVDFQAVTNLHESYSEISTTHLNDVAVQNILKQAVANWDSVVDSAELSERLSNISITVADLPDGILGEARGLQITLDTNAAGRGWFVDTTPGGHSEFFQNPDGSYSAATTAAGEGIDLLTVAMHEIGHVMGLGHHDEADSSSSVMMESVGLGKRLLLEDGFVLDEVNSLFDVAQYVVFENDASGGLADGIGLTGDRLGDFISDNDLLGDRVPIFLKPSTDGGLTSVFESPTVKDLMTIPVDANGDGLIDELFGLDADEAVLDGFDTNNDDFVDAEEFMKGFLFDPLEEFLDLHPAQTGLVVDFLEGNFPFSGLDDSLTALIGSSYSIEFDLVEGETEDLTDDPGSEITFTLGFDLTVSRNMPIDLGLEADALKILPFTGDLDNPNSVGQPEVLVTTTLSFAFEFGIFTGGDTPNNVVDQNDFFIRRADQLTVRVESDVSPLDFNFNVGFLGAEVDGGSLLLKADVETDLVDPNDPILLGFENSQLGVESSSGSVTGNLPVPSADLDHDVGFFLRIGKIGESTPIVIPAGNYETLALLEDAINTKLVAAGLGELVEADIDEGGTDKLTFSLPASLTANPLGFGSETVSSGFVLTGDSTLNYSDNVTFLVSENGELPGIVSLRFEDPSETEIGFTEGQTASLSDPLIATNLAIPGGDIAGVAEFTLRVRYDGGGLDEKLVSISDASTDDNTDIFDLVSDLDDALDAAGFIDVVPSASSGRILLTGNSNVAGIKIVSINALGESGLGFTNGQQVTVELTGSALGDPGFDDGDPLTDDTAVFHMRTNGGGFTTYEIDADPGRTLIELVAAITTEIGGTGVVAVEESGKVQLKASTDAVWAIEVLVDNQDIDDLEADLQRALDVAGITTITAGNDGTNIQLVGDDSSDTLEVTNTLTFDAGITYFELAATPTEDLFDASKGSDSKVKLLLPVDVLPGLEDYQTGPDDDYTPEKVAIVGNFDPFDSAAATYDEIAKRFSLNFDLDPSIANQDTPVNSVPTIGSLSNEIVLVNFAELLNFSILTSESMLGLIDGLGTALQQLSDTAPFLDYDIPFADANLSDLINFSDSNKERFSGLIDLLLFDTGGDGVDDGLGGNDSNKLLKKVIVDGESALLPAFSTAQTLGERLDALFFDYDAEGDFGINATYDTLSNELTYQLSLRAGERTTDTVTSDVSFVHNVPLDPFQKLSIDFSVPVNETSVTISGKTGLDMTFGVDLSPPGFLIFPTTELGELNGGQGVKINRFEAITGTEEIPVVPVSGNPTPSPVYQLSGDATFAVKVGTDSTQGVILDRDNFYNRTMGDFAEDVNNSLVDAGLDDDIVATYDGQRLVLRALDETTSFEITAANPVASNGIGLTVGMTSQLADFVVTTRDGVDHVVSLDSLNQNSTVQQLLDHLNLIAPLVFEADFNATQTGIRLVDLTGSGGEFTVESINGSGALLDSDQFDGNSALLGLGLFLTGDDSFDPNDPNTGPNTFGDGDPNLIEGGGIGLTSLDGRFFIRDAQIRIDGLSVETPDAGVPGKGLYGIVGVDVNVDGSLLANVTAQITDPGGGDTQITLKELLQKTDTLANPLVNPVFQLDFDNLGAFSFSEGGLLRTAVGDSAVILNVVEFFDSGTLLLANVKGDFTDDEVISQRLGPIFTASAEVNGTPDFVDEFGNFDFGVTVQSGFTDIGFDANFNGLDGASYSIPFALTGFGEPIGPTLPETDALDLSLLGDLEPMDKFSYEHLRSTLEGLLDVIDDVNSNFDELNYVLPAINRSLAQLVDFYGTFERGVDNMDEVLDAAEFAISPDGLGLPALRLQDVPRALRGTFGLPDDVDPDGIDAVDWVKLSLDTDMEELLLDMNVYEAVSTKLGLDIETGGSSPNLTSAGVLEVSAFIESLLNVAVDLNAPSQIYLLDTTNIAGALHVQGEGQEYAGGEDGLGLVFWSSVGPLSVFIQDGDVLIDFAFSLPGLNLGNDGRKLLANINYEDDWQDPVISSNVIDIVLPMFYGGEGPNDYIGEYAASGQVGSVSVLEPDYSDIVDDIVNEVVPYDPFENILLAIDTLDLYLELLSDSIAGDVLGLELPFISDQMADILFIEDFRRTLTRTLKNGIENAVNPDPDSIVLDILNDLASGPLASYFIAGPVQADTAFALPPIPPENRYREWAFTIGNTDIITINDFDIGPDHLTFDLNAPVTVTFTWSIKITFGVDYGNGAYIDVSDGNELNLDLQVRLPANMDSIAYPGEIGFFKLNVKDPGSDSGLDLFFDIDVKNGSTTEPLLGFAEIGSLNPVATLYGMPFGGADDAISFTIATTQTLGLPILMGDFIFDWELAAPVDVSTLNGDAVTQGIQSIELNNMELDALSGIQELLGAPFEEIAAIIDPFMPVVDVLTAAIPILSDLAGEPFTLLDLAGIFGEVDPSFIEAVADILTVISYINDIVTLPVLPLGDFTLYTKGGGDNYFDPSNPTEELGMDDIIIGGDPNSPVTGLTPDYSGFEAAINGNSFLKDIKDQNLVEGLSMPIFETPIEGINLLVNRDADLVTYQLPELVVAFDYLQTFPVWGPLAVSIEINFSFTLDLHAVGFDTFGYRRYAETGFRNEALIFDGFFLADGENGTDLPEIVFQFGLVGAAEVNLGIARAGVGGGINAIITFDWHDSIPDGNVHASEIIGNIIQEGGNPLAPFDVGGALTFQMFAFLEVTPLGIDKEFPITPETTLFDFNESFDRKPKLGTVESGVLYLNMGPNSEDRLNGDTSDGNEEFYLRYIGGGDVKIWSPKLGVDEGDAQTYEDVTEIVGLGGEGDDKIIMYDFDTSTITGDFDGGVGDDTIEFSGSTASSSGPGSVMVGGLGNDTLTGGHLNDIIYGNEGNDTINGSGGYDILFGDEGRVAETFISSRIRESDGADTIDGGKAEDIVIGAGGNDTLNGGDDTDLILGDGGRFDYSVTDGHVDVAALLPTLYLPPAISNPVDPAIISAGIDAVEDEVLDAIRAANLGIGGNDTIMGDGGNDLILGGTGDDLINGNAGDDVILAGKGFDEVLGDADNDFIFGGDQADTLSGNSGDDIMAGGTGNDFMHGNEDNDVMKGGTGADVMFGDAGDDQVFGQTEPDLLYGGVDNDLVVGGTSNDIMFGDDGIVAKLDPSDGSGLKVIGIGFGGFVPGGQFYDADKRTLDLIITDVVDGDGDDILSGDAGDDIMLGGGGNDLMGGDVDPRLALADSPTEISEDVMIGDGGKITFNERRFRTIETVIGDEDIDANVDGEPFNDVIYGDNGQDYIFGGRGNDYLFGGHGKVVDVNTDTVGAFRGVTDPEASDNDIIVGDNGLMKFADDPVAEASLDPFGYLTSVETTDSLNITGGSDYIEGELDEDVIFGGVNDLPDPDPDPEDINDELHGNNGNDVIIGDNGELNFALDSDTDLNTLDLIRSYRDGLGGIDIISGDAGNDVLIGGTAGDLMFGDNLAASNGSDDGEDIMLGDNGDVFLVNDPEYDPYSDDIEDFGRLYVQVAASEYPTTVDLITTTDSIDLGDPDYDTLAEVEAVGGADTMSGNAKADIMLGGVNNGGIDYVYGDREIPNSTTITDDGDDIMLGDNGLLDFTYMSDLDRTTLDLIRSFEDELGGEDNMSGNKGLDVALGGTGGDTIYGDDDDASAGSDDLGDLLMGDNADIFLVAIDGDTGPDLKVVLDTAVKTITTTDTDYPTKNTGGADTISGNAGGDIIAGGVEGDTIYGDQQDPVSNDTTVIDGVDVILGDNGSFEWLSTGRLGEIYGIEVSIENPDLNDWFAVVDEDLGTLDLITTEQPTNGGRDIIHGDDKGDLIFGGTDSDIIHGDDDQEGGNATNNDVMFGDHGRIYPHFARWYEDPADSSLFEADVHSRNFFAIDTGADDGGEGDLMWGEEGDDLMIGQQGDDRMWGGSEDDDMIGGHNVFGDQNVGGGYDELPIPNLPPDPISAVLNGLLDMNDIMDGGTGDDSMAGDNTIIWRRGDDASPRFRDLTLDMYGKLNPIYTTSPDTIETNVDSNKLNDPDEATGRDVTLLDHNDDVEGNPNGRFGADIMAGGADNDVMYGQLGNDLMQGDGAVETSPNNGEDEEEDPFIVHELEVTDNVIVSTVTYYFNIPEAESDGNDYMEGNGGDDLMYGGRGQDDIVGGSSNLFGLNEQDYYVVQLGLLGEQTRPDGSDIIFGGAGVDISYNDIGDAVQDVVTQVIDTDDTGHARDADFIMGDNANVYRLVDSALGEFYEFEYDKSSGFEYRGMERIIPRAMEQLDYTLGGADYEGGTYTSDGAADIDGGLIDNGKPDLIHGEAGDDHIFGMTGSDAIYGEGQDDDIVGGYGNDWISGGTGQDGVLGDDGLVLTSRNNDIVGEPLYGIAPLLSSDASTRYSNGDALDELIYTPGDIQIAIINPEGELKKTMDLVPFSYDPEWIAYDDEFPDNYINTPNTPYADDIIFGGLGSDFLHGASGDDAISGAEALPDARVPAFDVDGNPLPVEPINLGYNAFDLPDPVNPGDVISLDILKPGDVLAFNPEDVDGQHLNNRYRAGEFLLYNEYDPRRMILLDDVGELYTEVDYSDPDNPVPAGDEGIDYFQFLLNFDETEGVVRDAGNIEDAHGQGATDYPQVWDDGKDAIFGDLGNDWLVGGTGRDNIYGGWGNDLLNADDKHNINDDSTKQNTVSDTHPYYEDRAYGGAGRDVLIGNTGGDRLIDWVGEYNSYLVPFAPFGQATVSRTLQPFLPEFLYALSAGDGADPTRYSDAVPGDEPTPTKNNPIPSRFGEPHGELGLVLQKDFAWQQQTGAPADPQAGNIPGGHRDVLRTAGFNNGEPIGFFADSGLWTVSKGAYQVEPEFKGGDALSVFHVDEYVPSYFEIMATLNPQKPTGGYKSNAYLVFDYHSDIDFKFAGINVSTNKLEIGHRTEGGWFVDVQGVYNKSLKPNTNYNVFLAVNGTVVTLVVDSKVSLTHTFDPRVDDDGLLIGFNQGMVGLGANNSIASIDNVIVQRLAPEITFTETTDFATNSTNLLINPDASGWSLNNGTYTGMSTDDSVISLMRFGVAPAAVARLITTFSTTSEGGFVFDYYAPDDFKFVIFSADTGALNLGHRTSRGWTVDATFETGQTGVFSQDMEVTLKGTTASVTLNDQLVLGHAFNALITDGAQGLLGASGETQFETLTFQTDDLAYILDPVSQTLESGTESSSVLLVPVYDTFDFYGENDNQFSTLSDPELTEFPDAELDDSSDELYYLY